jgi:hypothetical protein
LTSRIRFMAKGRANSTSNLSLIIVKDWCTF